MRRISLLCCVPLTSFLPDSSREAYGTVSGISDDTGGVSNEPVFDTVSGKNTPLLCVIVRSLPRHQPARELTVLAGNSYVACIQCVLHWKPLLGSFV